MKNINRFIALLLSGVLVLGTAACGSSDESAVSTVGNSGETTGGTTSETSGSEDNKEETEGTSEPVELEDIVVAGSLTAPTYDPSLTTGMGPYIIAYEGLYKFDENGNPTLGLAESVDVGADGLTYTYKIRDDAYYNDGRKVTAQDFEYSWKRLADPATAAMYGYLVNSIHLKNAYAVLYEGADPDTLGVHAEDDSTLVVEFDSVLPYFEKILLFSQFVPINQEVCEAAGDQFGLTVETAAPSAGAFYLTDWNTETHFTYTKNENYYDADKVQVASVQYQIVSDTSTALMLWNSGEADNITLNRDTEDMYANDPAFTTQAAASMTFITPNRAAYPELQNVNLLKALALSFNKEQLATSIVNSRAKGGNYIIPEDFSYDSENVTFRERANQYYLEYDVAAAQGYWETAKTELGIDSITLELSYLDMDPHGKAAQYIQSEIQNNLPGVTIELKAVPYSSRIQVLSSGDFQLFQHTWTADYDDSSTYFELWTTGNAYNYSKWSNSEYDSLFETSGQEADELKRIQELIRAEEILMDEVVIIPVYQSASSTLVNPDYEVPFSIKGNLWQYAKRVAQ